MNISSNEITEIQQDQSWSAVQMRKRGGMCRCPFDIFQICKEWCRRRQQQIVWNWYHCFKIFGWLYGNICRWSTTRKFFGCHWNRAMRKVCSASQFWHKYRLCIVERVAYVSNKSIYKRQVTTIPCWSDFTWDQLLALVALRETKQRFLAPKVQNTSMSCNNIAWHSL